MSSKLSDDEIYEIASRSMAGNEALGVSGILFCMNDRFIQVLEGEHDVVGALYERIAADPRHRDVVIALDGPLETRAFANWALRVVGEDDLSPSEQAIVIHALRSVESPTCQASQRPTMSALLAGPLGHIVAGALRVPPGDTAAMETADRLLRTAEDRMLDPHPDPALTLERIAQEAGVAEAAARRCFQDLDDLIHVGARRALAIEALSFIDMMVEHRFENRADVALAIVAFVLMSNAERDGLHPGVNRQIRRDSFEVTRNSARAIAETIQATKRRDDRPFPGLTSSEIAMALTATAAAARTLIDFDAAALGRPRNQDWLLRVSIAALGAEAG